MKDINYANCMQRRCQDCKHYDYCFGYRPKQKGDKENEIQNKQQRMDNNGNIPTIN